MSVKSKPGTTSHSAGSKISETVSAGAALVAEMAEGVPPGPVSGALSLLTRAA